MCPDWSVPSDTAPVTAGVSRVALVRASATRAASRAVSGTPGPEVGILAAIATVRSARDQIAFDRPTAVTASLATISSHPGPTAAGELPAAAFTAWVSRSVSHPSAAAWATHRARRSPSSTPVSFAGLVARTAVLMIRARSAALTGRPRAASASAMVGTASASTAVVRVDHADTSCLGDAGDLGLPILRHRHETPLAARLSARRAGRLGRSRRRPSCDGRPRARPTSATHRRHNGPCSPPTRGCAAADPRSAKSDGRTTRPRTQPKPPARHRRGHAATVTRGAPSSPMLP